MLEDQAKGKTGQKKTEKFTITHKCGLHLRPAGLFVKIAKKYQSHITVEKDGAVVVKVVQLDPLLAVFSVPSLDARELKTDQEVQLAVGVDRQKVRG